MARPRTKADLVKMLNENLKKDLEKMDTPKPHITFHKASTTHGEAPKVQKSRKQRREQKRELRDQSQSGGWDL